MAVSNETLDTMRGYVLAHKPNANPELVRIKLNERIRAVLDRRTYWSDLGERRVISLPAAYTAGTISLTAGSKTVTGAGTSWPVSDVVNTTLAEAIRSFGIPEIKPASMTGITGESILWVDNAGDPEAVVVRELRRDSFFGMVTKLYAAGVTVTQSSLVGRQLRVRTTDPIFTIRAVRSATSLELDQPWGGESVSDLPYSIRRTYVSLGLDLRKIVAAVDSSLGLPIAMHITQTHLNTVDPKRLSSGNVVQVLSPWAPSENGAMLYEVWPQTDSVRQIPVLIKKDWPEMKTRTDRPPFFIDPQIIKDGAIADVLRIRANPKDEYFDPRLAREFEAKFESGLQGAVNADESRAMSDLQMFYGANRVTPGADFWQQHVPEVLTGELWGFYG